MTWIYRRAIADADLAIAASGWAVLFWRLIQREKLTRISDLALFKALLETPQERVPQNLFFVLPRMQSGVRQFRRCSDFLDGDALMAAASGQIRPMDLRSLV